ncbi:MAG: hypoxanthine phosphoribosyltransferase [Actinomycetota bacterium]
MSEIASVLFAREEIGRRISELGREIAGDYGARDPILVSVLKGGTIFLADLMRSVSRPLEIDFLSISGFGDGDESMGRVRILKDLDTDIAGRDVLLVEDIVDTGLTLAYLLSTLEGRGPDSVRVCALLDKSVRRIAPVEPSYVGFDCPDRFVIGYGLDFRQRYRNLADILAVDDMAALQADPDALVPLLDGDTGGEPA